MHSHGKKGAHGRKDESGVENSLDKMLAGHSDIRHLDDTPIEEMEIKEIDT